MVGAGGIWRQRAAWDNFKTTLSIYAILIFKH
jgi:hypothetical protein